MLLRGPSLSLFVYISSLEFAWKHSEFFLLVFRIFVSLSYCQTETQFTVQMIDFQIYTYMVNHSKTSLLTLFVAMIDTLNSTQHQCHPSSDLSKNMSWDTFAILALFFAEKYF